MASVAEQSVAQMGGRLSVLNVQKRDHIKLDRLLRELRESRGEAQAPVLLAIHRLVFPHAFAEESVLWPVIRRVLPDGEQLTLRVEQEHQQINELMKRLEALKPGSAEHEQVLAEVVPLLQADVRDEEDALLPGLQAKVSPARLRMLGVAWEGVRRIAPTRPHPIVARRPPGNVLSALPLTLLDRSRDRIDAWFHCNPGSAAPALRALGTALTAATNVVERLPGMRSGEDPTTRVGNRRRPSLPALAAVAAGAATAMVVSARRRRAAEAVA